MVLGNIGMPRPETKRSHIFGKFPDWDWDCGVWSGPDWVPISPGPNFPNTTLYIKTRRLAGSTFLEWCSQFCFPASPLHPLWSGQLLERLHPLVTCQRRHGHYAPISTIPGDFCRLCTIRLQMCLDMHGSKPGAPLGRSILIFSSSADTQLAASWPLPVVWVCIRGVLLTRLASGLHLITL